MFPFPSSLNTEKIQTKTKNLSCLFWQLMEYPHTPTAHQHYLDVFHWGQPPSSCRAGKLQWDWTQLHGCHWILQSKVQEYGWGKQVWRCRRHDPLFFSNKSMLEWLMKIQITTRVKDTQVVYSTDLIHQFNLFLWKAMMRCQKLNKTYICKGNGKNRSRWSSS